MPQIIMLFLVAGSVDAFSLLQKASMLQKKPASVGIIVSIPLSKQMTPVIRDNKVVSHKSAYFGTIKLGAPVAQEFSVVFDTGSGHVILPGTGCNSEVCLAHRRYDTKASNSAHDIDADGSLVEDGQGRDQVTIGFGTGEVTGEFAQDQVCLGSDGADGTGGLARCVGGMKLVQAVAMSEQPFGSFAFDGVVGLGLSALSLDPDFSFLNGLSKQGRIARPHVGIFIADSDDGPSEISFGGHRPERLQGPLNWAPVTQAELGYWQIRIKGIRVGGKPIDFCDGDACTAIIDTGSSHIGVPAGLLTSLQDSLSTWHAVNESVDCRDAVGPDVQFDLDGFSLNLRTKDYARRLPFTNATDNTADTVCRPRLMRVGLPPPLGPKLFILGEPILRRYMSVFDWGEKKVGFGLAAHDTSDDVLMLMQSSVRLLRRPAKTSALASALASVVFLRVELC